MRNYEVTFIVDPVLSGDEIKKTAQAYSDMLTNEGCTIVHTDKLGLRQLAYPINKKSSGVYYSIEFQAPNGSMISGMELAFRRDERIMRFLTVALDRYGVKYNDDKRNGLIGKSKRTVEREKEELKKTTRPTGTFTPAPAAKEAAAPVVKEAPAPVAETPAPAVEATPDDLTKIEGIGPKTSAALIAAGISSFETLSTSSMADIQKVLDKEANLSHLDPTTWAAQSKMASNEEWEALQKWQDELDGGKVVSASSEEE